MFRILVVTYALIVAVALMPAVGFAAEHGGAGTAQEHGGAKATPAAPRQAQSGTTAPAATAATAPAPAATAAAPAAPTLAPVASQPVPAAPPALKPILITFSGDLASVDTKSTPAMVTVTDRYGVKKEISVPAEAKIAQGSATKALTDLKAGDKVTVEYTYDVATGKRTAQAVTVGEAAPSPTS